FAVHPEPLAFNAHLTGWRTPKTGSNRAAFYLLNWMRKFGVPWLQRLCDKPLTDMQELFDIVPANICLSALSRGSIAFGMIECKADRIFAAPPLSTEQDAALPKPYGNFLDSLVQMNRQAVAEAQAFLTCMPTLLDLSTEAACAAIVSNDTVSLRL